MTPKRLRWFFVGCNNSTSSHLLPSSELLKRITFGFEGNALSIFLNGLCSRESFVIQLHLQKKWVQGFTTAVVKQDKTSGLDRNHLQTWFVWKDEKCEFSVHTFYQIKSIKYWLLLLCARLKISCISRICCVWNNACVHVCKKTTDDLYA